MSEILINFAEKISEEKNCVLKIKRNTLINVEFRNLTN